MPFFQKIPFEKKDFFTILGVASRCGDRQISGSQGISVGRGATVGFEIGQGRGRIGKIPKSGAARRLGKPKISGLRRRFEKSQESGKGCRHNRAVAVINFLVQATFRRDSHINPKNPFYAYRRNVEMSLKNSTCENAMCNPSDPPSYLHTLSKKTGD